MGARSVPDLDYRLNRIRSRAQGRVLEISAVADVDNVCGPYDDLVVHDVLGNAVDSGRVILRMIDLLADPDGVVWFLEPTAGSRGSRQVVDVPTELRSRGLFVTDLDRFRLNGEPRERRNWVEGCARRNRRPRR